MYVFVCVFSRQAALKIFYSVPLKNHLLGKPIDRKHHNAKTALQNSHYSVNALLSIFSKQNGDKIVKGTADL